MLEITTLPPGPPQAPGLWPPRFRRAARSPILKAVFNFGATLNYYRLPALYRSGKPKQETLSGQIAPALICRAYRANQICRIPFQECRPLPFKCVVTGAGVEPARVPLTLLLPYGFRRMRLPIPPPGL